MLRFRSTSSPSGRTRARAFCGKGAARRIRCSGISRYMAHAQIFAICRSPQSRAPCARRWAAPYGNPRVIAADSCDREEKMTTGAALIDTLPVRLRRALLIAAGIYLALLPTGWATAAKSIAFGASAALALLILALSPSGRGESIPSPGTAILAALFLWLGCALASAAWSVHLAYTLGEFRHELAWGLLTMAIFYIAACERQAWRTLVAVVLGSFALLAVLAAAFAASPAGWD